MTGEERRELARLVLAEVRVDLRKAAVRDTAETGLRTVVQNIFGGRMRAGHDLRLATPRGFEPPISTVTGWHVSPLHHGAAELG